MAAIVPTAAEIIRLCELVDDLLTQARIETGDFNPLDYKSWRERHDAALAKIIDRLTKKEGARFTERPPHDHAVKMAGIRSTSTSGFSGALHNWIAAAQRKHLAIGRADR